MKSIAKTAFLLCILMVFLVGCINKQSKEKTIVDTLNNEYSHLVFKTSTDIYNSHLRVFLKNNIIDTLELFSVFDNSVIKYRISNKTSWTYLSVFNNSQQYLFSISKADSTYSIFKDCCYE